MPNKKIQLFLKILVSLGFVFWIIYKVDWKQVIRYFEQMDIWWMFAFIAFYSLGIAISSYKWRFLALYKHIRIGFGEIFKIYLTGALINNFFPSIVGGDAYRSYKLGKLGDGRYLEATSTVLADRITGLFGVMILIVIFSAVNFKMAAKNEFLLLMNYSILAFFSAYLLFLLFAPPIMRVFEKILPRKVFLFFSELHTYNQSKILVKSLVWGAMMNFFGVGVATWMLFLDLHIPIGFANFMVAISAVSIVSSIPVSIGNVGIKEWAFLTFFGLYGVDGAAAISIAIFARFLQMLISFFAIPFYLQDKTFLKEKQSQTT
jgi:glycosyltransferase 2 family protein